MVCPLVIRVFDVRKELLGHQEVCWPKQDLSFYAVAAWCLPWPTHFTLPDMKKNYISEPAMRPLLLLADCPAWHDDALLAFLTNHDPQRRYLSKLSRHLMTPVP